eukprot:1158513-Pelagomonas_calceolata.AAC.4
MAPSQAGQRLKLHQALSSSTALRGIHCMLCIECQPRTMNCEGSSTASHSTPRMPLQWPSSTSVSMCCSACPNLHAQTTSTVGGWCARRRKKAPLIICKNKAVESPRAREAIAMSTQLHHLSGLLATMNAKGAKKAALVSPGEGAPLAGTQLQIQALTASWCLHFSHNMQALAYHHSAQHRRAGNEHAWTLIFASRTGNAIFDQQTTVQSMAVLTHGTLSPPPGRS